MKRQTRRSPISTRGRITIPADLRKRLGFKPGTRVDWNGQDGRLVLTVAAAKSAKKETAGH